MNKQVLFGLLFCSFFIHCTSFESKATRGTEELALKGCCYTPDSVRISSKSEYDNWLKNYSSKLDIPDGMSLVLGGTTWIGSEDGLANEKPTFEVRLPSFLMDKNMVTVSEFREFVEATGYITEAQEIGDGIVFSFRQSEWTLVSGATWEYPLGPNEPAANDGHPVTMLSYRDAVSYLDWVGKRLPTEIEWEHAARGITDREKPYSWGGELIVNDSIYMANTWNGFFPMMNTGKDGFFTTSPVGMFGTNEFGLSDMGGNVWEWTSDWYRPYERYSDEFVVESTSEKVLRGGSFMCHTSYCHGYRVSARSSTPPSNTMFHIGFRGVKDVQHPFKDLQLTRGDDSNPQHYLAQNSQKHDTTVNKPTLTGVANEFWKVGEKVYQSNFNEPQEWVFQIENKENSLASRIRFDGINYPDALEVFMPGKGATIWLDHHFKGAKLFRYKVHLPEDSLHLPSALITPRDVNVFWHASDPVTPNSRSARLDRKRYTGQFSSYNKQKGYYASMGGANNTTTRFRRYPRSIQDDYVDHIYLNDKDGQAEFLLEPGKTYQVELLATNRFVQYVVDGKLVYELDYQLEQQIQNERDGRTEMQTVSKSFTPYLEGWFGFRLLKSHHVFSDFEVFDVLPAS